MLDFVRACLAEDAAVADCGLAGGPGLSAEDAWVLTADLSDFSAMAAIIAAIPGAEIEDQEKVETEDDLVFGVYTLVVHQGDKTYHMQLWFDATLLSMQNPS